MQEIERSEEAKGMPKRNLSLIVLDALDIVYRKGDTWTARTGRKHYARIFVKTSLMSKVLNMKGRPIMRRGKERAL